MFQQLTFGTMADTRKLGKTHSGWVSTLPLLKPSLSEPSKMGSNFWEFIALDPFGNPWKNWRKRGDTHNIDEWNICDFNRWIWLVFFFHLSEKYAQSSNWIMKPQNFGVKIICWNHHQALNSTKMLWGEFDFTNIRGSQESKSTQTTN